MERYRPYRSLFFRHEYRIFKIAHNLKPHNIGKLVFICKSLFYFSAPPHFRLVPPHFVCSGDSTAILAFRRVFRPGTYFYSRWGGTSSILEGHRPEMYSSGTGPVTFFRGTILAWGAHFSLGRHTSRMGGGNKQ